MMIIIIFILILQIKITKKCRINQYEVKLF
jgi:hypothetical protein